VQRSYLRFAELRKDEALPQAQPALQDQSFGRMQDLQADMDAVAHSRAELQAARLSNAELQYHPRASPSPEEAAAADG
jgi:hypothetical protein